MSGNRSLPPGFTEGLVAGVKFQSPLDGKEIDTSKLGTYTPLPIPLQSAWFDHRPTKPGHYWAEPRLLGYVTIICVTDDMEVYVFGNDDEVGFEMFVKFAGPIEVPE